MEQASPATCKPSGSASSRLTDQTANVAGAWESPTPKTPSRPLGPPDPSGDARDVNVESIRVLRVVRTSARKDRTQALNQMRSLISTAPEVIRAELRGLNVFHLLERASSYRPGTKRDIASLTKLSLRLLARRAITLEEEVAELDAIVKPFVKETAPELVGRIGHRDGCRFGAPRRSRRQSRPPAQRGCLCPPLRYFARRSQ